MTTALDRVSLPEVKDLLVVGLALPFRVLDAQGRLLLNEGHVLAEGKVVGLYTRGK